jgi:hypothetical protein
MAAILPNPHRSATARVTRANAKGRAATAVSSEMEQTLSYNEPMWFVVIFGGGR